MINTDRSVNVWIIEYKDNKNIWFKNFSLESAKEFYETLKDKGEFNFYTARELWNNTLVDKVQVAEFR